MTQEETWMLACIIQMDKEEHGYHVILVDKDSLGEWYVKVLPLHGVAGVEYDYFHSSREWYEVVTRE